MDPTPPSSLLEHKTGGRFGNHYPPTSSLLERETEFVHHKWLFSKAVCKVRPLFSFFRLFNTPSIFRYNMASDEDHRRLKPPYPSSLECNTDGFSLNTTYPPSVNTHHPTPLVARMRDRGAVLAIAVHLSTTNHIHHLSLTHSRPLANTRQPLVARTSRPSHHDKYNIPTTIRQPLPLSTAAIMTMRRVRGTLFVFFFDISSPIASTPHCLVLGSCVCCDGRL
jgi:hypothetical protein